MWEPDVEGYFEHMAKNFDLGGLSIKINGSFDGNDISDYYRSPVEMGWARNIKFDHEFIGRKALKAEVANPKRTIVTLEFNSDDMIDIYASMFRKGEPGFKGRQARWRIVGAGLQLLLPQDNLSDLYRCQIQQARY